MKLTLTKKQRENLGKALLGLTTVNAAGFIFNPGETSLRTIVTGCIFVVMGIAGMLSVDR